MSKWFSQSFQAFVANVVVCEKHFLQFSIAG